MSATSCEMCHVAEDTTPVCIDDNMETWMCYPCIRVCRKSGEFDSIEELED